LTEDNLRTKTFRSSIKVSEHARKDAAETDHKLSRVFDSFLRLPELADQALEAKVLIILSMDGANDV
jgi:hypothetical protein